MEDLFDDGGVLDSEIHGTNRSGIYSVKIKLAKDIPQLLPIMGRRIKIQYKGVRRMCTNCFGQHPKQACRSQKLHWLDYTANFISANKDIRDTIIIRPNQKPAGPPTQGTTHATKDWVNLTSGETFEAVEVIDDNHITQMAGQSMDPVAIPHADAVDVVVNVDITTNVPVEQAVEQAAGPSKVEYQVPSNKVEHDEMIRSLVKAGIRQSEAEQIISMRKTAYNKASKDFKKPPNKCGKQTQKKAKRMSKHFNNSMNEYDN